MSGFCPQHEQSGGHGDAAAVTVLRLRFIVVLCIFAPLAAYPPEVPLVPFLVG